MNSLDLECVLSARAGIDSIDGIIDSSWWLIRPEKCGMRPGSYPQSYLAANNLRQIRRRG